MKMIESPWAKKLIPVIAITLLAMAAVMIFRQTQAQPQSVVPETWFGCTACDHYFHQANVKPPITCPQCDQKAAWPAMRCSTCRKVVGVDRQQLLASEFGEPLCSACHTATLKSIRASDQLPPSKP